MTTDAKAPELSIFEDLGPSRDRLHDGGISVKIGNAVLVERREKARTPGPSTATIRLAGLQRLIDGRYGGPILHEEEGELFLSIALPWIINVAMRKGMPPTAHVLKWAKTWTPISAIGHDFAWFEDAVVKAQKARWRSTDQIAQALHISQDEVARYQLRSFAAFDRPKRIRKAERKAADRERKQQQRRQKGRPTREEIQAEAQRKRDEATAAGVSLRTMQRRKKVEAEARVATASTPTT